MICWCVRRYKKEGRWESESKMPLKILQNVLARCTNSGKRGKTRTANMRTQGRSWKKGEQEANELKQVHGATDANTYRTAREGRDVTN